MSNIEPRSGRRVTRAQREKRAYQLVVAGGTFGVIAAVGLVLTVVGVVGAGLPLLSAILAVVCLVLFRRTVGS